MSNMRWDEKETYQFVKLYLSHNSLWNPNHEKHKVINERKKAYQAIIDEFMTSTGIQLNEYEVKRKIKNLRSTYSQEINKIRTRSGPLSKYIPTIKWFADWHQCFRRAPTQPNIDTVYDEHTSESESKPWLTNTIDQANDEVNNPFAPDTQNFDFESSSKHITKLNRITSKKKRKKLRVPSTSKCDRLSSDTKLDNEDEFDLYGCYIASQLRHMDKQKAIQLKLAIQSLINKVIIAELVNDL